MHGFSANRKINLKTGLGKYVSQPEEATAWYTGEDCTKFML